MFRVEQYPLDAFVKEAENVRSQPTEENWKKLREHMSATGVKYYRVHYMSKRMGSSQDLLSSYVELYDSSQNMVATVPVYKRVNGDIVGALEYLSGLRNLDLVI